MTTNQPLVGAVLDREPELTPTVYPCRSGLRPRKRINHPPFTL